MTELHLPVKASAHYTIRIRNESNFQLIVHSRMNASEWNWQTIPDQIVTWCMMTGNSQNSKTLESSGIWWCIMEWVFSSVFSDCGSLKTSGTPITMTHRHISEDLNLQLLKLSVFCLKANFIKIHKISKFSNIRLSSTLPYPMYTHTHTHTPYQMVLLDVKLGILQILLFNL